MSWVCSNCSNLNEDESACCAVCGCDRPTESHVREHEREHERESETVEGKVVFSDFAVITESTKMFFCTLGKIVTKIFQTTLKIVKKCWHFTAKTLSKIKSKRSKRPPREDREVRERVKKDKTRKVFLPKQDFAKPWAEHDIKFDVDVIKSKGFVRSEQTEMNSVKGYTFYKADGSCRFIKADMLIVLNMAKRV